MASSDFSDERDERVEEAAEPAAAPQGGAEVDGSVRRRVAILEKKLIKMEERLKDKKKEEIEFVDSKQLRPEVLKDGTAFKVWREEFERWAGIKVKGMQEVLRWIGGRREWTEALGNQVRDKLKEHGHDKAEEEIDGQLRIALEAYTTPTSQERKIIVSQKGGLRGYLELCKHHDLRTDANANRLRSEIMELGKSCKNRRDVREAMISLESKRTRLAEMVMNEADELQLAWMKTILM